MNGKNQKKRKKKKDSLSVVIKVLVAACACAAIVVVGLAVKAITDTNKDVVPFVSDVSDTVQVEQSVSEETTTKLVISNDSQEMTAAETTTQPVTAETAPETTQAATTTESTTAREFTLTNTTAVSSVVQTTVAGLVADEDRIVVNPERRLWNLVVVNAGRKIPAGYEPELAEVCNSGVYMDCRVAPWYDKMYYAAKQDGITLVPYSGYRSYARQERNYNNLTETYMGRYGISRKEAAAKAATVILPPGTSEHNLGLAMDICNTYDSFATQKEYRWLMENAHKYGFILRYTAEKQPITGIVPEPWHWRYVGVEYAEKIKNSGLCLEEYLTSIGVPY